MCDRIVWSWEYSECLGYKVMLDFELSQFWCGYRLRCILAIFDLLSENNMDKFCMFISSSAFLGVSYFNMVYFYFYFNLRYMILATTMLSTFVKYVFYVSDMIMEGQWERKHVYTFYLELIRDLLHLSMYLCFFVVIFMWVFSWPLV